MKRRQIGNQMDAEKPLSAFSRREMKKAHFFKKNMISNERKLKIDVIIMMTREH